jgi:hypothetical protein
MLMNKPYSHNKLLEKAVEHSDKTKTSRSKLEECRTVILHLKNKKFTNSQIRAFLADNNITIDASSISRYLKKNPATEEELEAVKEETDIVRKKLIANPKTEEKKLKQKSLSEIKNTSKEKTNDEEFEELAALFGNQK